MSKVTITIETEEVSCPYLPAEYFKAAMAVIEEREADKESGQLKPEEHYVEAYGRIVIGMPLSGDKMNDATSFIFYDGMPIEQIMARRRFLQDNVPTLYDMLPNVITAQPQIFHPYIGLLLHREL